MPVLPLGVAVVLLTALCCLGMALSLTCPLDSFKLYLFATKVICNFSHSGDPLSLKIFPSGQRRGSLG